MTALRAALLAVALAGLAAPAAPADGSARLEPRQVERDLRVLHRTLTALHPGLYRYATPADLDSAFARERRALAAGATRGELLLAVSRITAGIRCGHTFVNPANQPAAVKSEILDRGDRLPLRLALVEGRLLVTASAAQAIAQGDEVLAIGGRSAREIAAELVPLVRADGGGEAARLAQLADDAPRGPMDAFLPLLHRPADGAYRLTVRRGAGPPREVAVPATTVDAREARLASLGTVPAAGWSFRIDRDIAIWTLPTFAFWNDGFDWKSEVARRFDELERSRARHLVLDLRGNEGGDSAIGDSLLARLAVVPTRIPGERAEGAFERVPYALARFLETWDYGFFDRTGKVVATGGRNLLLTERDTADRRIAAAPRPWRGRTFALIGPRNRSASFLLARALKTGGVATLVGQATGGNQRGINGSEIAWVTLPESNLAVDVPLVAWFARGDAPDGGVEPDVPVARRFADLVAGVDPEMREVRRLIAGGLARAR